MNVSVEVYMYVLDQGASIAVTIFQVAMEARGA